MRLESAVRVVRAAREGWTAVFHGKIAARILWCADISRLSGLLRNWRRDGGFGCTRHAITIERQIAISILFALAPIIYDDGKKKFNGFCVL